LIALDASVLLAAEDSDDAHHQAAARLLELGVALATIELAVYEIANVAIRRWNDPESAARLADRAFAIAELGHLLRVDRQLADAAADLADEHRISVYDAAYVACAHRLGVPLASCDERDLVNRGLAEFPSTLVDTEENRSAQERPEEP
jgi:predicted nucleic acid-binding protein